jgi:hypothetical protein
MVFTSFFPRYDRGGDDGIDSDPPRVGMYFISPPPFEWDIPLLSLTGT